MMDRSKANEKILTGLLLVMVCALSVSMCIFTYKYDNKYTAKGPQAINGMLMLDEGGLSRYPVMFLVNGWEYYGGRLLSPDDFMPCDGLPTIPDETIFIGQYGGFEAGDFLAEPHGSASYALNITIPEEVKTYTLALPEIFSAYRLYINGSKVAAMGSPDPSTYYPETGNKTVTFQAQKSIAILIAVSDFSHLYSGIVYPPIFGMPDNVSALLNARFLFRSVFCVAAATIGVFSILIGLMRRAHILGWRTPKNTLAILYGLLCLFFVGYVCYPITQTFINGFYPLYVIENFSFCAMLLVVILLQRQICPTQGRKQDRSLYFVGFGLIVCVFSLLQSLAIKGGNLNVMVLYSRIMSTYEWVTAGFITFSAIRAVVKNLLHSKILLCGILMFDCALMMDRLLPMFEPIVTGWFPEMASFVLVLSIGTAIGKEVAVQYKNNAILEERASGMERLSQMRQSYYPILQQKITETQRQRHDLRHHLVMIGGFLENGQSEKLRQYVAQYQSSIEGIEPVSYSCNHIADVLAHHYTYMAKEQGVNLTLGLNFSNDTGITDTDLCSLLSNLLENGLEACGRQKSGNLFVRLAIEQKKSMLAIRMENASDGNFARSGSLFLSSKEAGRKGYGLESIKNIAARYGGTAEFRYDEESKIFISVVVLLDA